MYDFWLTKFYFLIFSECYYVKGLNIFQLSFCVIKFLIFAGSRQSSLLYCQINEIILCSRRVPSMSQYSMHQVPI